MSTYYTTIPQSDLDERQCDLAAYVVGHIERSDMIIYGVMGVGLGAGGYWAAQKEGDVFMQYVCVVSGILLVFSITFPLVLKYMPKRRRIVIALSQQGIYYKKSIFWKHFRFVPWDKISSAEEKKTPLLLPIYGWAGSIDFKRLRFYVKTNTVEETFFEVIGMNISENRSDILRIAGAYINAAHA